MWNAGYGRDPLEWDSSALDIQVKPYKTLGKSCKVVEATIIFLAQLCLTAKVSQG